MSEGISTLKHGYYAGVLGYSLEEAMEKSLADLEYEFFSTADPSGGIPDGTSAGQVLKWNATTNEWEAGTDANTTYTLASQVEIESAASTTARLISGQRVAQAVAAYLNGLTGKAAGRTLKVNAANNGFEWVA